VFYFGKPEDAEAFAELLWWEVVASDPALILQTSEATRRPRLLLFSLGFGCCPEALQTPAAF
jgi:hypothetical protein